MTCGQELTPLEELARTMQTTDESLYFNSELPHALQKQFLRVLFVKIEG